MTDIHLAAAPVSWGVTEVAEGAARLPWQQVMDEIAQAGYAATELGPYGYYPTDAKVLRAALEARNLALTSAFIPLPIHNLAAFPAAAEEALRIGRLLAELGAEYVVLSSEGDERRAAIAGIVPVDGSSGLNDEEWRAAAGAIETLARRFLELGLQSVFHHHAGTYVETPFELATLCRLTSAELLGICLDTGHYVYGGGSPREAIFIYGERIRYVHLKDLSIAIRRDARKKKWPFVKAVEHGIFAPLGSGGAAISHCIADLKRHGYQGWAVVEQDIIGERDASGRTPLEGMSAARSYLRELGL